MADEVPSGPTSILNPWGCRVRARWANPCEDRVLQHHKYHAKRRCSKLVPFWFNTNNQPLVQPRKAGYESNKTLK
eukprot:1563487-Amphidinium_carterae.1